MAALGYGTGDIGTPGAAGGMLFAPSAVPVPAAAWLFISGLLVVFSPTAIRKALVASATALPRITAKEGGSKWPPQPFQMFADESQTS